MSEPCQNCGKREATINWTGEGGTLAFSHGIYARWCDVCATEAQIAHCEKMADELPKLRAKLADLLAAPPRQETPTP